MKGMLEAVKCAMCSKVYQADAREPLLLPCGHTFCRACLASVKITGSILCPTCKQTHNNLEMDQLYVSYSILGLASNYKELEYETCSEHGDDLRYWCRNCELPLCSLCLYSGHPQGHNVQLATAYIQEKKVALEAQIKLLDQKIEDQQENVRINFDGFLQDVARTLSDLCQAHNSLYDFKLDVTSLLDQTKVANRIKFMVSAEDKVKQLHVELQEIITPVNIDSGTKSSTADDTVTNENSVDKFQYVHQVFDSAGATGDLYKKQTTDSVGEVASLDQELVSDSNDKSSTKDGKMMTDNADITVSQQENTPDDGSASLKISHPAPLQFGNLPFKSFDFTKSFQQKVLQTSDITGLPTRSTAPKRSKFGDSRTFLFKPKTDLSSSPDAKNKQQTSGVRQQVDEARHAQLDFQDGRLLLYCLAHPADTRLSLQLPSEVFLELSVGGRCLGRVYIQLWCHLRRAQQFLALCQGTLGPSYLGTQGTSLITRDKDRKGIIFQYHMKSDKVRSHQPVFTNLELGSSYEKPVKEGMVMQCSTGPSSSSPTFYDTVHACGSSDTNEFNNSGFSICTKGDPERTSNCPFGEVLSGLEVVKAAVFHHSVTEITITKCGLVLPHFFRHGLEQPSSPVASSPLAQFSSRQRSKAGAIKGCFSVGRK